MTLQVIGVGVGRTGTRSLKLALNRLGLGPCHHMEDVLENMAAQVPLWAAAVAGRPDWNAIFSGYKSAVDWPTAGFFRDLAVLYPSAKFVLTTRSPESWTESFSQTVYKVLAGRDRIPEEMREWFNMASTIIAKDGFPDGLDSAGLTKAFIDHNDAVNGSNPGRSATVLSGERRMGTAVQLSRPPGPGRTVSAHQRSRRILGAAVQQALRFKSSLDAAV